LFRRRVKLDRKSGDFKIGKLVFKAQKYDSKYHVYDQDRLLGALEEVRFDELPDDVVVRASPQISQSFQALKGLSLKITREGLEAFFSVDEWAETLVDPVEFAHMLETTLRENGFDVNAANMYTYSAKYADERFEAIGHVIQRLNSTISHVSWSAAEGERSRQAVVDGWVSRLEVVDGRLLAGRRDVYGVARWLTTPLTSQDITYILFHSIPPSFNLGERIAKAIVRRLVDNMNESLDKLIKLGLIKTEKDSGLVYTPAGSALKRLLEKIVSGEAVPVRRGPEPRYDPIQLLYYIGRNFAPLALQRSSKLRGNKRGLYSYVEKMLQELTFIHVAAVTSIYVNIYVPRTILSETQEELVRLGFISHRMKIKPFGEWLATLTKGYLRKTGILKNVSDWRNILNWQSLPY